MGYFVEALVTPGSSSHRFIQSFQDTYKFLLVVVRDTTDWGSTGRMCVIINVNDIPASMNNNTRACFGFGS